MVTKQKIDFTNVKEGGLFNKARIPAGDYLATVTKVEDAEASDGIFQYLFTIKLKNKHVTSAFPYYCKLQENQLWKIRNLMVAAGKQVPKKVLVLDPTVVVGKTIAVSVQDTEYKGKPQSEIGSVFPASELTAVEEEPDETETVDEDTEIEEEPEEAVEEEAEEEVETGDQFDDMDRAALKAFIKEQEPAFKILARFTDDELRDQARTYTVNLDEVEEEEVEEEEEEEEVVIAPPKKRGRPRKQAVTEDLDIEDM